MVVTVVTRAMAGEGLTGPVAVPTPAAVDTVVTAVPADREAPVAATESVARVRPRQVMAVMAATGTARYWETAAKAETGAMPATTATVETAARAAQPQKMVSGRRPSVRLAATAAPEASSRVTTARAARVVTRSPWAERRQSAVPEATDYRYPTAMPVSEALVVMRRRQAATRPAVKVEKAVAIRASARPATVVPAAAPAASAAKRLAATAVPAVIPHTAPEAQAVSAVEPLPVVAQLSRATVVPADRVRLRAVPGAAAGQRRLRA